jgi:serine/threonine protein kinase
MVSEWMDNGNVNEFIQKRKEVNRVQLVSCRIIPQVNRYNWIPQLVDITQGLDYMHNLQFVHGDLKGVC